MGSARSVETVLVNCARESFYRVLCDYESMPQFLEDLSSTRVESVRDNVYRVTYEIKVMGKRITYTLELSHKPGEEVRWNLVKGEFMKTNQGRWLLEDAGPGKTRATYEIEMGFGLLVPGTVISQLQKIGLPRMLEQFKKRAETLYGN